MDDDFKNRLLEAMKTANKNMKQTSVAAGLNASFVSNMLTRGNHPSFDNLRKIAEALETTPDFLLNGEFKENLNLQIEKQNLKLTPIVGTVEAGVWREAPLHTWDQDDGVVPENIVFPNTKQIALRVAGESMNELIQDGEIIYCIEYAQWGSRLKKGDILVVQRERAGLFETTLKQVGEVNGSGLELWPRSTDERYQSPIVYNDIPESEVTILYVVVGKLTPFNEAIYSAPLM